MECVPVLLAMMTEKNYPQIQLEATWVLTNITCLMSSECQSIVDKDGLKTFLTLVSENQPYIAEQALWGLGNISADSAKFRDAILDKGGLETVIKAVEESTRPGMLEQGAWTLSQLCRGDPKPKYNKVKSAIPVMGKLVMSGVLKEEEVSSCLWALAVYSDSQKTRIQQIVGVKGLVGHLF